MNTRSTNRLIKEVDNAWPLARWDEFHVVVAVSGGADSVALLRTLVEVKKQSSLAADQCGRLIVAHFNHRLRGSESNEDAEFVSQLSVELGLEFVGGVADEYEQSEQPESENHLRDQRYRFLVGVARQSNSRYIVTAHHRADQIETVLFRLFRGTGLNGLCGIPQSRVVDESLTIVRPMLDIEKSLLEQALEDWKQPWREDATNSKSQYTRNFIRNEVLPSLRDRFPDVDGAIRRLSGQAYDQQVLLSELTGPLLAAVKVEHTLVTIDCPALKDQSAVLLRELFSQTFRNKAWPTSQMGYQEFHRLAILAQSTDDAPRFQLPGGINCEKRNGKILLWNKKTQQSE